MSASEQLLLADLQETFSEFLVSLQDLRNPTEEFVSNFYSFYLHEFGVDICNIRQTQFKQNEIVGAYPDAYSEVIPKINLLKCVRAFEVVPDFGMLDIVSPTPKRTQEILRAFLNFYNWSDQSVSNLIVKKQEVDFRKAKFLELANQKQQLREKLNSIAKNIPKIKDDKSKLEGEISLLEQQNEDLKISVQEHKVISMDCEKTMKEKETILQKLNNEDLKIKEQVKNLDDEVVDSPTTILAELDVLREKHDKITELREEKRDIVEGKGNVNELLQEIIKELEDRATLLQELFQLIHQVKELKDLASATQKDKNTSQEILSELKSMLLANNNKKQTYQEKLQSLYLKWKTLKPQLTENVESALRDLKSKKATKNEMIDSLKKYSEFETKVSSITEKITTYNKKFMQDYEQLNTRIDQFFKKIEMGLIDNFENQKQEILKKLAE